MSKSCARTPRDPVGVGSGGVRCIQELFPAPRGATGGWAPMVPGVSESCAQPPGDPRWVGSGGAQDTQKPCPVSPPIPQKMLQCPYFFFDVVYIHNGAEEKEDETSWKVSAGRGREGMEGGGQ